MGNKRGIILLTLLIIGAMFIAGCGSDDSAIEQSEDIEVVDVEEVIDINDYILDGWEFYEAYEIDPPHKVPIWSAS